jgi:hypothetical protein
VRVRCDRPFAHLTLTRLTSLGTLSRDAGEVQSAAR